VQRTGSILVIDRDPTISDLILDLLTDEGYVAYAAPNGAGALAAIARHPPALLLLDIYMHDMSSAELIAQIYRVGSATMPIVLMATMSRDAAPLLVPGSIECLAKPFDIDDLLARVVQYVRPADSVEPAVGAAGL
jgi:two-component system, OmpR family, KDP operon response regulator KdpE